MEADAREQHERRKPGKTKRYTRYVLDPFQIFCIERRADYLREHPDLKNSEITSLLGSVWRTMHVEEKTTYNNLAMQLQHNKCNVERKTKKPKPKEDIDKKETSSSTPTTEISEPDVEPSQSSLFRPQNPPNIFVVGRSGVGDEISEVSYTLLKQQASSLE